MYIRTLFLLLVLSCSCTFIQERYPTLPPGPYRAVLKLENNPVIPNPKGQPTEENMNLEFEEVTRGELPFTFEVNYVDEERVSINIFNGEEIIQVPAEHIHYGRDLEQGRDTLRIDFPVYDTHISAYHEENVIEGVWVVHYRDNYRIPFVARFGQNHRFTQLNKPPAADLSGRWSLLFEMGTPDEYPGLAELRQEGNELRGTIRTETGDYRYLEGTVQDNKAYLSVFDGSHAFLFEALIKADGTLSGSFRSGRHYIADWTGSRAADDFELADPDSLTHLVEEVPLSFSFSTPAGVPVSIDDEAFVGKVKLVQIFGTWCPNCRDETNFLKDFLATYERADELAIIGLAFERYGAEDDRSKAALERYVATMDIPWPLLLAGGYEKAEAGTALPMLNRVISYPTLLFLDRSNRVRRIHTGFNGPATSAYSAFTRSFYESIDELLSENPDLNQ